MAKNRKNLKQQIRKEYNEKLVHGVSKHKASDDFKREHIFSSRTLKNYQEVGESFAKFCKENHQGESQTIEQCRPYVAEYLQQRIDKGLSPYTILRDASALGKLYRCDYSSFGVKMPLRERSEIIRSRNLETNMRGFSEKNNQAAVDLIRCTGLRRREAENVKPKDFYEKNGKWYVHVSRTYAKGGREREVELQYSRNPKVVERTISVIQQAKQRGADEEKIFDIKNKMPCHAYRHEFAKALYESVARDTEDLPRSECWCCTKELYGVVLDREAMRIVSNALGHNRLDVTVAYLTSDIE